MKILLVALTGILFIIILYAVLNAPSPDTSSAAPPTLHQPSRKEAALGGVVSLKESMRNPDSFSLDSATIMANGAVCYVYRAQNGFGGMNVERAVLTPNDTLLLGGSGWTRYCAGKGISLTMADLF